MTRAWIVTAIYSATLFACVGDGGFSVKDDNDPDNPDTVNCRPSDLIDIYVDSDGDGYGNPDTGTQDCEIPVGYVANDQDCDDNEPRAYLGATDFCGDKIDNDCSNGDICETSLIGHWNFVEASGTDALDYSGNLVTGLLRNGLLHTSNPYLAFDGNDDFVEVLDADVYQIQSGTVSFWFMPNAIGIEQGLVSKDSNGRDAGGQMTVYLTEEGTVRAKLESANETYDILSLNPVTTGQWHHVAFTFGGNDGMTIYVDDIEGGKDPYTGHFLRNKEPMAIGASTDNSGNETVDNINKPFSGQIADVQIYDRQLLRTEITSLKLVTNPVLSGM